MPLPFLAESPDGTVVASANTLDACIVAAGAYFTGTRLPLKVLDEHGEIQCEIGVQPEPVPMPNLEPRPEQQPIVEHRDEGVTVQHPAEPLTPAQEEVQA